MHEFTPDQGWSIDLAKDSWGDILYLTAQDTHPPLYYFILKCWFLATGEPTLFSGQIFASIFSALAVWAVWELARELSGEPAAWCAAATAALAPYAVYWGHAVRMHSMQPLFAAMIVLFSARFLAAGGRAAWAVCAASWAMMINLNYMGFVFGAVWGLAFVILGEAVPRRRAVLAATPLPGLAVFAGWFPILRSQMAEGPMNINFFQETVSPIYLYFHALFGAQLPYQPPVSGIGSYMLFLVFAVVCVAGARRIGRRWWFWVLLLGSPTLPIVLASTSSWTLAERHLLFTLPLFYAYWGVALLEAWAVAREYVQRRTAR